MQEHLWAWVGTQFSSLRCGPSEETVNVQACLAPGQEPGEFHQVVSDQLLGEGGEFGDSFSPFRREWP